jgi:phosphate transport system substrate-binding protein
MVIETGGSLPAYVAASRGAIDLAAMTRGLTDAEDDPEAHHFLVAKDALAIVVHASSALTSLRRSQVRALLTGETDNWQQLDGPARPVQVYAAPRASVARHFAEEFLLEGSDFAPAAREPGTDAAMLAALAVDPAGVACVAARSALPPGVMRLRVEQVAPTPATILSGRYPYAHSFYLMLYGARDGARARFLDFARSPAGQAIVSAQGMTAVCAVG